MKNVEVREEIRIQVKAMDSMIESLLDWAEEEASADTVLIEKLKALSFATDSFLTLVR